MGCVHSKPVAYPTEKEGLERSARIDRRLRYDKKVFNKTIKILLLGAGESGKSTIIKQMRILHKGGFPEAERRHARAIIYSNLIVAFKVLLDIIETESIQFQHEKTKDFADLIDAESTGASGDGLSNSKIKDAMKGMWEDSGVQEAINLGHEYAHHDNLHYFFNSLDRIFAPGWLPNNQDMLQARQRTREIKETIFEIGQVNFHMTDVGGQRSERRKWIHCFEGVHCLLFMVALSGYDQCLLEDPNVNQMQESIMLFESLANSKWFRLKPIILFLNKVDLFKRKLAVSPIAKNFPDYTGSDTDFDAATKYFANRFRAINRTPDREIYIHYTNATDTTLLEATMKSVQDIIIRKMLYTLVI